MEHEYHEKEIKEYQRQKDELKKVCMSIKFIISFVFAHSGYIHQQIIEDLKLEGRNLRLVSFA